MQTDLFKELITQPWREILLSGGEVRKNKDEHSYTVGGFYVVVGGTLIYISGREVAYGPGRDEYDFFIEVCVGDCVEDPRLSKYNYPPYVATTTFPEDCRLDYLLSHGVEGVNYKVHPKSNTKYFEDINYGLLMIPPLRIYGKNGCSFEIVASYSLPESIDLSMLG